MDIWEAIAGVAREEYRRWVNRARAKTRYAIRIGRLVRPDVCSRCKRDGRRIQAHHADYSKPLDVYWLCALCHTWVHKGAALPARAEAVA